jgi:ABC-type phosphate/phosphonate transport system substrate-binding protein
MRALSYLGAVAAPHYQAVAEAVAAAVGAAPPTLVQASLEDVRGEVADPRPALAFLCGLPYVLLRTAGAPVEALAAPAPDDLAEPEAPIYFSDLMARPGAPPLERCRVGYNGTDSLSGWVLPRSGLDRPEQLDWACTGSHRRSLELLLAGEIDVAPIDSHVFRLERRRDPRLARLVRLRRIGPMPAPPVVAFGGDAALRAAMRAAILRLPGTERGRRALRLAGLARYEAVTSATYEPVRRLALRAPA